LILLMTIAFFNPEGPTDGYAFLLMSNASDIGIYICGFLFVN